MNKARLLKEAKSKFTTEINLDHAELLDRNYDNHIWDLYTNKCVECHGCTFVCPTCLCFNVLDSADAEGVPSRHWDPASQVTSLEMLADIIQGARLQNSDTGYTTSLSTLQRNLICTVVSVAAGVSRPASGISIIDIVKELQKYEEDISRSESRDHRCDCNLYIRKRLLLKKSTRNP